MTIEFSPTVPFTFAIVGLFTTLLILAGRGRTSRADALRASWEAWRAVSERALEKGQPVPPTPGEQAPKR